jgi:hypothetical protein
MELLISENIRVFYKMNCLNCFLFIVIISLIILLIFSQIAKNAPEASEDETGFHKK